jgi:hypothetical protein
MEEQARNDKLGVPAPHERHSDMKEPPVRLGYYGRRFCILAIGYPSSLLSLLQVHIEPLGPYTQGTIANQ